jgi:hypothetical protein
MQGDKGVEAQEETEKGRKPSHDRTEMRQKALSSYEKVASISCARKGGSMVKVHAQQAGPEKALVDRTELQQLIDVARQVEEVELIEVQNDLPAEGLMRLAQEGGSFSSLADPREEVYTLNDLKVRYK